MTLAAARALIAGRERYERGTAFEPTLLPLVIAHLDDVDLDQAVEVTGLVTRSRPFLGHPFVGAAAAAALARRLPSPADYAWALPDVILWMTRSDALRVADATLVDTLIIRLAARGDIEIPDSWLPSARVMFDRGRPGDVVLLLRRGTEGGHVAEQLASVAAGREDSALWLPLLVPFVQDGVALARDAVASIQSDCPPWQVAYLVALLAPTAQLDHVPSALSHLPPPFADLVVALIEQPPDADLEQLPAVSHPFGVELMQLLDEMPAHDRTLIAHEVVLGIAAQHTDPGGVPLGPTSVDVAHDEELYAEVADVDFDGDGAADEAGFAVELSDATYDFDLGMVEIDDTHAGGDGVDTPAAVTPEEADDPDRDGPAAPEAARDPVPASEPPPAAVSPAPPKRPRATRPRRGTQVPYLAFGGIAPPAPRGVRPRPVARTATGRLLQADVTVPDWPGGARTVARSFARGQLHRLALWIGHERDGRSTTLRGGPIDENAVVPEGSFAELDVTVAHNDVTETKALYLPTERTRSSKPVEFDLRVGAGQHNVSASIVVSQGGRILHQSVLRGAVSSQPDGFGEGRLDLETEMLARASDTAGPEARHDFDVAVASPGPGAPSVVLSGRTATIPSTWTEAVRGSVDLLAERLFDTAKSRAADDTTSSWDELLRVVATQGHLLHGWIISNGYDALQDAERIQLTDADPTQIMPIEFVYDRGSVSSTATACPEWEEALATGACHHCDPQGGEQMPHVCPLGFWGLNKIIERQTGASDGRPPGRLRPMRSATLAASGAVLEEDYEATRSTIAEAIMGRLVEIDSWTEWDGVASETKPTLVVVLPHQGFDAQRQNDYLEIGAGSRLPAGDVRFRVIKTEEEGPIVLLLGCKTADATLRYRNFAAEFRTGGASIVVATLSTILGRDAAPVAQQFVRELAATGPRECDFGTLIRTVRRKMVAQKNPAAFGLVSFGDIDWVLV